MSAAAAKTTTKTGIVWNIVCTIVCIIFIPFIVCSIYLSIATAKDPDNLATIFGKVPVVVMSGSMSPVFEEDDLILLEKVDTDSLQKEDIICFKDDDVFVTHRISRIEIKNGEKRFYTMGDHNGVEDKGYVLAERIQGKYTGRIPKLGGVILFIQDPYGLVLTMILLLLLFITGELIIEILEKRMLNKRLTAEVEQLRLLLAEREGVIAEKESVIAEKESVVAENVIVITETENVVVLAEQENVVVETKNELVEKVVAENVIVIAEQAREDSDN